MNNGVNMAKYTIETNGSTADSIDGNLGVVIEVCGRRIWVQTPLSLTPYTEPDIEQIRNDAYSKGHNDGLKVGYENLKAVECERIDKAYKRGYDDAKHECQDCQKIMMDAEQERVDKAYQQGLNDAENRKATCEFCGYVNKGELDEPCKFCANNYLNMFRPRKDNKLIRKNIKDIMDSLDCTISDFEKAIEEIKNETD